MARDKEPFLSRWSRRKLEPRRADAPPAAKAAPAPAPVTAGDAPPALPPIDQLNFDSDFKGFLHPKVDEALRRRALKKLFASAHFQTPDMMDDFNEDYTKVLEALAPEDAQKLAHVRRTLLRGEPEASPAAEAEAEAGAPRAGEGQAAQTGVARADAAPPKEPAGDDGAPG